MKCIISLLKDNELNTIEYIMQIEHIIQIEYMLKIEYMLQIEYISQIENIICNKNNVILFE